MKQDPTSPRLPPLTMLRAFEAAGRTGSMRRAADDIGVSHTVVSRHVKNLEHWMGRKLVLTSPRGAELTPDGQTLFAAVSKGFELIARAAEGLRARRVRGRLRIWCYSGLATRWLAPRLSELEEALDGAEIDLTATEQKPDFSARQADVFIGFSVLPSLPVGSLPLVRPRMFPVASKSWLDRHGWPHTLEDLADLPLIHEGNHVQWDSWFQAIGYRPERLRGPKLSNASISFDAALAGQGIALVNAFLAADELVSGRLIEPFPTDASLGTYFLLAARDPASDATIAAFARWMTVSIARFLATTEPRAPNAVVGEMST